MSETVIAALIAGAVTLIVCIINNRSQQKRLTDNVTDQQRRATDDLRHEIQLLRVEMSALSEKVEKHNNLVERMYRIEEVATLYEEKMKVANHRIDDLEKHIRKDDHCV